MPDSYKPERLPVACQQCPAQQALPAAYVQGGVLIIQSRHRGETHTTVITLEEVRRLLQEARPSATW